MEHDNGRSPLLILAFYLFLEDLICLQSVSSAVFYDNPQRTGTGRPGSGLAYASALRTTVMTRLEVEQHAVLRHRLQRQMSRSNIVAAAPKQ